MLNSFRNDGIINDLARRNFNILIFGSRTLDGVEGNFRGYVFRCEMSENPGSGKPLRLQVGFTELPLLPPPPLWEPEKLSVGPAIDHFVILRCTVAWAWMPMGLCQRKSADKSTTASTKSQRRKQ